MPNLTRTHDLRVRLTNIQYEILRNKAHLSGFGTVAEFARYSLIQNPFLVERMIKEMYELITKKKVQNPASERMRFRRVNSSSDSSPDANFCASMPTGEDA